MRKLSGVRIDYGQLAIAVASKGGWHGEERLLFQKGVWFSIAQNIIGRKDILPDSGHKIATMYQKELLRFEDHKAGIHGEVYDPDPSSALRSVMGRPEQSDTAERLEKQALKRMTTEIKILAKAEAAESKLNRQELKKIKTEIKVLGITGAAERKLQRQEMKIRNIEQTLSAYETERASKIARNRLMMALLIKPLHMPSATPKRKRTPQFVMPRDETPKRARPPAGTYASDDDSAY